MSIYDQLQGVATGLLTKFKQGQLTLDVFTAGSGPEYDPTPPTYASIAFDGTVRGVSTEELSNSTIHASDLVVTMPGAFNPDMKDTITIDGDIYNIVKITAAPSAGVKVAQTVFVRA